MNSTSFRDKPQRNDPSVTNTYFNSGKEDGGEHGHVKYRDNPDGTTDYLYARDVEGNEYDVWRLVLSMTINCSTTMNIV